MTDDKHRRPGDAAARLAEIREGKKPSEQPLLEAEEIEWEEGAESFTTLSADRRQKVMLELRFQTADAEAFPYSYLSRARFDPSKGILLDFTVAEVQIMGRNLRPLFAGIVAQRVAAVLEQDDLRSEATLPKDATVVTRVEVRDKNPG